MHVDTEVLPFYIYGGHLRIKCEQYFENKKMEMMMVGLANPALARWAIPDYREGIFGG